MPLTIDGSPVREVTIDGTLVTALTIDGSIVFDTIESFEDGDIAEYALDTGSYSVQTGTVYNGSNALKASFAANTDRRIVSTDFSVSNGNAYRTNHRTGTTDITTGPVYGVQDETSLDGYYIELNVSNSNFTLFEVTNGSFSQFAEDTSVTYSTGVWHEVEFDWGSSGSLTATLFDETGSQISQITGTDSTFTSGGIGWRMFNGTTNSRSAFFDWLREV